MGASGGRPRPQNVDRLGLRTPSLWTGPGVVAQASSGTVAGVGLRRPARAVAQGPGAGALARRRRRTSGRRRTVRIGLSGWVWPDGSAAPSPSRSSRPAAPGSASDRAPSSAVAASAGSGAVRPRLALSPGRPRWRRQRGPPQRSPPAGPAGGAPRAGPAARRAPSVPPTSRSPPRTLLRERPKEPIQARRCANTPTGARDVDGAGSARTQGVIRAARGQSSAADAPGPATAENPFTIAPTHRTNGCSAGVGAGGGIESGRLRMAGRVAPGRPRPRRTQRDRARRDSPRSTSTAARSPVEDIADAAAEDGRHRLRALGAHADAPFRLADHHPAILSQGEGRRPALRDRTPSTVRLRSRGSAPATAGSATTIRSAAGSASEAPVRSGRPATPTRRAPLSSEPGPTASRSSRRRRGRPPGRWWTPPRARAPTWRRRVPNDGLRSNAWTKHPFAAVCSVGRPRTPRSGSPSPPARRGPFRDDARFDEPLLRTRSELDEVQRRGTQGALGAIPRGDGDAIVPMLASDVLATGSDAVTGDPSSRPATDAERRMERWSLSRAARPGSARAVDHPRWVRASAARGAGRRTPAGRPG